MKTEDQENLPFIIAQYNQIWESSRTHLRLSWQIPAFTMVIIATLVTTAPANIGVWQQRPLISGVAFLVLAFSIFVLFIHHRRNNLFVREYGRILQEIESRYGIFVESHHYQISKKLSGLDKMSSTSMLIYFLWLATTASFLTSLYFFSLAFA